MISRANHNTQARVEPVDEKEPLPEEAPDPFDLDRLRTSYADYEARRKAERANRHDNFCVVCGNRLVDNHCEVCGETRIRQAHEGLDGKAYCPVCGDRLTDTDCEACDEVRADEAWDELDDEEKYGEPAPLDEDEKEEQEGGQEWC